MHSTPAQYSPAPHSTPIQNTPRLQLRSVHSSARRRFTPQRAKCTALRSSNPHQFRSPPYTTHLASVPFQATTLPSVSRRRTNTNRTSTPSQFTPRPTRPNNTRRHSKALHATTTAQHGTTDLAATSEQTYSVLVATPPLSTTDLAVTPDQLYSWRFSPSLQTTTIQVGSCRHCSPRRATSNQSSQSGPDHHTTILDSTPLHGTSRRHTA